jgi:hypothetical protein
VEARVQCEPSSQGAGGADRSRLAAICLLNKCRKLTLDLVHKKWSDQLRRRSRYLRTRNGGQVSGGSRFLGEGLLFYASGARKHCSANNNLLVNCATERKTGNLFTQRMNPEFEQEPSFSVRKSR